MQEPELAVVVLSLGAPPQLLHAITSLKNQSIPVEIVVVNSGGGPAERLVAQIDDTIEVVSVAERLWPGAARNRGIRASRADWIAFMASDHIASRDWAANRLARHRQGRSAVACAVINSDPRNLFAWTSHIAVLVRRLPGVPPSEAGLYGVSYARDLFRRYGEFREDLRIGEDTEFNARLADEDQPIWAPEVQTIHANPTTFRALMADQFARGRRNGLHWRRRPRKRLLGRALSRFGSTLPLALKSVGSTERVVVLVCVPLLLLAIVVHEFGIRAGAKEARRR